MKARNTIILLVIALAIGSYIWFYEKDRVSTREREQRGERVFRLTADDIDRIEITKGGETVACARDDAGEWRLEKPLSDRADESVLRSICSRLESLASERTIPAGEVNDAKRKEYGVKEPGVKVSFRAGGKERELMLGKDTPLGNSLYAAVKGKGDVLIVPRSISRVLDKKVKDYRDKTLVRFDVDAISKAEIRRGKDVVAFAREDDEWRLTLPVKGLADPNKIGGALRKVRNLRVIDFVSDSPGSLGEYGLAEPAYEVTVWDEKGESSKAVLFGKEKEKNKIYAKRRGEDTVVTVNDRVVKDLELAPNDYRDKKVTRLAQGSVEKIEIRKGDKTLSLAKKGKKWEITAPGKGEADAADVRNLLRGITDLTAGGFVSAEEKDRGRYGIGEGAMEITLVPKKGEAEKILVGKEFDRGKRVYLLRAGSGEIVTVPSEFTKRVSIDPIAYRKKQVLDFNSADAVTLSVALEGKPPVVCEKSDDKEWKITAPEEGEARSDAVNVMLTTLAHLHARKFVASKADDLKKYGLAKPAITATVEFNKAGEREKESLLVGKKAEGETYYAKLDGGGAVFTIPSYMVKNLRKDLVAEEKPE